jgi:hypothetical protein
MAMAMARSKDLNRVMAAHHHHRRRILHVDQRPELRRSSIDATILESARRRRRRCLLRAASILPHRRRLLLLPLPLLLLDLALRGSVLTASFLVFFSGIITIIIATREGFAMARCCCRSAVLGLLLLLAGERVGGGERVRFMNSDGGFALAGQNLPPCHP